VRPTLGKEPAAEEASPVGYLSGDTGIGLATFSIISVWHAVCRRCGGSRLFA